MNILGKDPILENVINKLDQAVAEAKNATITDLEGVDIETMMKLGLFPTENFDQYFVDRITMDSNTFKFWHGRAYSREGQRYELNTTWYYNTLDEHKRNGIHKAVSIPLMYLKPELVYKGSKRPKTDMDIFRSPLSITMDRNLIVDNKVNIDGEIWNVIPVTRYGSGMSRGMYHLEEDYEKNVNIETEYVDISYSEDEDRNGDIEKEYCGKFYYYEPESSVFLAYKTSRTYFNKTDALIKLGEEYDDEYINPEFIDPNLRMHMNGELPPDLMMTPIEYAKLVLKLRPEYEQMDGGPYPVSRAKKLPQIPHYIASKFNLYAIEDEHDQELCEVGKENNIQVIILTNMVGSHQVVTEILDTRSGVESAKSLIYTY